MNKNIHRKIINGCPVCGKLFCRGYGYSRRSRKWLIKKERCILKELLKKEEEKAND